MNLTPRKNISSLNKKHTKKESEHAAHTSIGVFKDDFKKLKIINLILQKKN